MTKPVVTLKDSSPLERRQAVEQLKSALAPSNGGPQDPEIRRLKARIALLEQQVQTLLARQGIKWVVRSAEAR